MNVERSMLTITTMNEYIGITDEIMDSIPDRANSLYPSLCVLFHIFSLCSVHGVLIPIV